jgi:hypothetical protein
MGQQRRTHFRLRASSRPVPASNTVTPAAKPPGCGRVMAVLALFSCPATSVVAFARASSIGRGPLASLGRGAARAPCGRSLLPSSLSARTQWQGRRKTTATRQSGADSARPARTRGFPLATASSITVAMFECLRFLGLMARSGCTRRFRPQTTAPQIAAFSLSCTKCLSYP